MDKKARNKKRLRSSLLFIGWILINILFYPNLWKSYYYKWTNYRPNIKIHSAEDLEISNYKDVHLFFNNDKPTLIWLNLRHQIDTFEEDSSFIYQLQKKDTINIAFVIRGINNDDQSNKWFVDIKKKGINGDYIIIDNNPPHDSYGSLWKEENRDKKRISHCPFYLLIDSNGNQLDTVYTKKYEIERLYSKLKNE